MAIIPNSPADKAKHYGGWVPVDERDAAIAAEREACAHIAQTYADTFEQFADASADARDWARFYACKEIADRIRARANQEPTARADEGGYWQPVKIEDNAGHNDIVEPKWIPEHDGEGYPTRWIDGEPHIWLPKSMRPKGQEQDDD